MSKTTKPSWQDNDALLTYRVGPVLCCGPTLPIITITPPPSLTHLPGTSIAEPGIFKHGSYIVSATDLRYRFGVKQENWKQPGQVIIAQHDDLTRGYYVDEIKDVIHFPKTGWGQLPAHLPRGIFSRTLLLDKQIYLYTEFEKLSQLQGSGYLAEYISQLENIKQSEQTQKPEAIKKPVEIKPLENNNPLSKNEQKIIQPAKNDTISGLKVADDLALKNQPADKTSDETPNITPVTNIRESDTSEPHKPLASSDSVLPKNDTATTVKETMKFETDSTDKPNAEKHNDSITKTKTSEIDAISTTKTKPENIASKNPNVENKTSATKQKVAPQTQTSSNRAKSSIIKDRPSTQTNKPESDEMVNTINKEPTSTVTTDKTDIRSSASINEPIEDNGSYFGLFIIFLILLMGAGGGYYYFSYSTAKKDIATQSRYKEISSTPDQVTIESENKPKANETNLTAPAADDSERQPGDSDNTKSTLALKQDVSNESSENSVTDNEYHANIKQEQNTITIELDGPLPPAIKNLDTSTTARDSQQDLNTTTDNVNIAAQDTLETNATESSEPKLSEKITDTETTPESPKVKPDITRQTKSIEIIHIIVKGDTLWAIAKHYLLNPFRYPELAKLSKIKNPDLIYPGNRVRIIYKNTSNK